MKGTIVEGRKKQSKAAVKYEHPATGMDHCGDCKYYSEHHCQKVVGVIMPQDWCKLFEAKK